MLLAVAVQSDQREGVRLRPAFVDDVLGPMAVGALLQPEDAVIVGHGSDDVVAAVAVHVVGVNETGVAEGEIGMPLPRAGARGGRGFEPTLGSDDVVAAIAVRSEEHTSEL